MVYIKKGYARLSGNKNPHWKGGKPQCPRCSKVLWYGHKTCIDHRAKHGIVKPRILHNGYYMLYKPDHPFAGSNGYVREHRWLMEQKLGRLLERTEHVHHKNHVPIDNRLENLVIISPSDHSSYHANRRWGNL